MIIGLVAVGKFATTQAELCKKVSQLQKGKLDKEIYNRDLTHRERELQLQIQRIEDKIDVIFDFIKINHTAIGNHGHRNQDG